jgi:hypothetical protein
VIRKFQSSAEGVRIVQSSVKVARKIQSSAVGVRIVQSKAVRDV